MLTDTPPVPNLIARCRLVWRATGAFEAESSAALAARDSKTPPLEGHRSPAPLRIHTAAGVGTRDVGARGAAAAPGGGGGGRLGWRLRHAEHHRRAAPRTWAPGSVRVHVDKPSSGQLDQASPILFSQSCRGGRGERLVDAGPEKLFITSHPP